MKKRHIFVVAVVGLTVYAQFSHKGVPEQQAQAAKVDVNPKLAQICKATAAMTFGRDYKIMKLDKVGADGIAYVHYNRPSDNSRWAIKCRLEDHRVLWASDNPDSLGRWRNDPADEVITYSINGNKLTLKQVYSDGSADNSTYNIK